MGFMVKILSMIVLVNIWVGDRRWHRGWL